MGGTMLRWLEGFADTTVDPERGWVVWAGEGSRMGVGRVEVGHSFEDFELEGVPGAVRSEIAPATPAVVAAVAEAVRAHRDEVAARPPNQRLAEVLVWAEPATVEALLDRGASPDLVVDGWPAVWATMSREASIAVRADPAWALALRAVPWVSLDLIDRLIAAGSPFDPARVGTLTPPRAKAVAAWLARR